MKTVEICTGRKYNVIIDKDILDRVGQAMQGIHLDGKALVVSDDNVAPIYMQKVVKSLEASGFEVFQFIMSHGESAKNTDSLVKLMNFTAKCEFSRSDTLVALGGGVVGDLTGLAAALYMRGINFVQLPTSLLAAVDSSVGGKTAVDLGGGKNLVGAFYQPCAVFCDISALSTLPAEEFSNGMSEVIKYGMICDAELLDILSAECELNLEKIICRCVEIKSRIVAADEFDRGERMLLNFGHTIGHAVELLSGYEIPHGSAVAVGMAAITRASQSDKALAALLPLLKKYSLPDACPFSAAEIFEATKKDKKNLHGKTTVILPVGKGESRLEVCEAEKLKRLIYCGVGERI